MFRSLIQSKRMMRMFLNRKNAEPEYAKSTTKRKKFTGSYAELCKLQSVGSVQLQDPSTGMLEFVLDFDGLP